MTNNEKINLLDNYQDILVFDELVELLDIGENTAYKLLQQKKIYSKKIGKEYKIPKYVLLLIYIIRKI